MNAQDWISTGMYAGVFLLLFGAGEFLFHGWKLPVEITRKFVHVGTGIICLTFPVFLDTHWSVLLLTIAFFGILFASQALGMLKSINAVNRTTRGSFLFPLAIYGAFCMYAFVGLKDSDGSGLLELSVNRHWNSGPKMFYFLPIMILTVSDPLAALVGKYFRIGKYKFRGCTKTLIGSLAFLLSAFIVSYLALMSASSNSWKMAGLALLIAGGTTVAEALSQKGFDNISIPATALGILYAFQSTWL